MKNSIESTQAQSSATSTLTGSDFMGKIYNVRSGRIARASSVSSTQLFDLSTETYTVNVGSLGEFTLSDDVEYIPVTETDFVGVSTDVYYSEEVSNAFSVNLGVSGSVGAFSGEMDACYSQTTENSYESSMALAKQYARYAVYKLVMRGDESYWRSLLKDTVSADINGSSLSGTQLVEKYGTHFLASGYFGGVWLYSQSISKYTATSTVKVTQSLEASAEYEGVQVTGSAENESETTTTQSESQTELFLEVIGGTTTSSYDDWQDSVNEGNWNLINFDNKTNISLQPLSVLVDPTIADYQKRVDEIDAAIQAALTPFTFNTLRWASAGDRYTVNSGNVEKTFILSSATDSHLVITGLAFKVDDSNVKVLNAQLLNLEDGTTDWYTMGTDGIEIVNRVNTETSTECDLGYVVTGVGLNAGKTKMYNSELYAQKIDALNINVNDYIGTQVTTFGDGSPESKYVPQEGNNRIITGIEVGVRDGDIAALYLHFGELYSTPVVEED